jgi:NTP pyrophosphatase (non-canonical NTP hydrolase)
MTNTIKKEKIISIENIRNFITEEHQRMLIEWGQESSQKERTLMRTIKLMEELGELSNEVLAFNARQRKEKMRSFSKEKIEEELADVLIVTMLLAQNMKVNIFRGLEKKIATIKKRWQNSEF